MTLEIVLKQLRAELNINQKEMAKLLGIDTTTMNRWEKGKIKPQRVSSFLLLNFAKERGISEACQNSLREALFPSYKIETEVNDLRTTEINRINELVNDSSNSVVVIDMDTYDILFANNKMLEITDRLIEEVKTLKCYQFLLHADKKCDNCREQCGTRDAFREVGFSSVRTGKHYLIRSKEITWSGRTAQIKYITDITEMHRMKVSLERRIHFEHQKILEEGKGLLTYVVSNLSRNKTIESKYIGDDTLTQVGIGMFYSKAIENARTCIVQEKDVAEFLRIHNRKFLLDNFEKGIQTYTQQYQLRTMQGHIIWASNTMNLYQDTLTDEIYLYEYCFDVFEQKLLDGIISASSMYHFDAFGMIFLNNGQLTKVHYALKEKCHTTETISYEEEADLLYNRFICEEDRHIREPYLKLQYVKKELEDKELISLMYRIKMPDGTAHRMLERISWYDRENNVCFISIVDIDKTKADINGVL